MANLGKNEADSIPPVIREEMDAVEREIAERRARRERLGFTVLYSGSPIYPWQGLNYLVPVVERAADRSLDMTFVMAVNQRTPNLPTTATVVILEGLDENGVRDAICASDVCLALHPEYHWSEWGFHNSPMKLYEYMACEATSLAANIGQMKRLFEDQTEVVLCENDPERILEKLQYLKANPGERRAIAARGWKRVQSELNWERNVDRTLAIFERALAER